MKAIALFLLSIGLTVSAGAGTRPASAAPTRQSATGAGQFHLGLPLRTFTFSASTSSDGGAKGEAQLDNRASGTREHVDIDCVNVIGNVAVLSGTVRSTDPTLATDALFAVRDNGEGPSTPPDEISLLFTGYGIACTDITDPTVLEPFFVPIEQGQIQVRS